MINFENISKFNLKYEMLYSYVRFVHNYIFYKKYNVLHDERIPKDVPVVAICNHQNGLSDALGILFAFNKDGRHPVFIARSDIFRKNLWAKLLRFLKIMPAFRAADSWAGGDLSENDAVFTISARILAEENKVVCLFPEAGHQDCRTLGTFKKGFARIAFKAAEMTNFEKPIYILPMGNHYSNYFSMQSNLMINIGESFEFSDLYPIYKEHPAKAQRILADRARPIVENLMLNIKNTEHYEQYDMLRNLYNKELIKSRNQKVSYFPNSLEADKTIVAAIDNLKEENPQEFDSLMNKTLSYIRKTEKLHLRDWVFCQKLSILSTIVRFILCIVLLPFIIFGFLNNFIPFNASTLITRKIKDQMLHSSFHFVMGTLFTFPLWYLMIFLVFLFVVGGVLGKWWVALIYVASLPLSLIIYLRGKIMWIKFYNRIRRFRFVFSGNKIFREAVELREEIVKKLREMG